MRITNEDESLYAETAAEVDNAIGKKRELSNTNVRHQRMICGAAHTDGRDDMPRIDDVRAANEARIAFYRSAQFRAQGELDAPGPLASG
jgi:hypothetical protein